MKGAISKCLLELIDEKFGEETSQKIIDASKAQSNSRKFRSTLSDVPDTDFFQLLETAIQVTGLSAEQAADAFGEYWCCTYIDKYYPFIAKKFENARDMLLGMDKVHQQVTATMENARPPRFDFHWRNETDLEVTYKSGRNMIDIYVGLARGVGKRFGETLEVSKENDTQVLIRFAA